jgi:hypothetical protein
MKRILDWFMNLFDTRSEATKQQDLRDSAQIKELSKTYHVTVEGRGKVSIIKKGKNEL